MDSARLGGYPVRAATLADALVPSPNMDQAASATRGLVLAVLGATLTALAAQVSFTAPWSPVPYTGQTAAVLLVGTVLGARHGAASMLLYVLAGSIGVPVFANGESGIGKVIGATGGYLIGFVVAAGLVGRLAARGWDRAPISTAALMAGGNLVIYALGVPVLMVVAGIPFVDAVVQGALVFLPWDVAKVLLATGLLPLAWRLVARRAQ